MTPVFSDAVSYLVVNPRWDVPQKLARLDMLPAFRKDPGKVARHGFQVLDRDGGEVDPTSVNWRDYSSSYFPFRLRQLPGPHNALGRVKLMFPNKHNVYLHDTPTTELFAKSSRAFSSGCVRVSNVLGLTHWLLEEEPEWNWERIGRVIDGGDETRINLKAPVPIHILYFTAVVEADGALRLVNDLYERDARLVSALDASPAPVK
jgi:murein L,D-transpeptidase YcbB/YkuD